MQPPAIGLRHPAFRENKKGTSTKKIRHRALEARRGVLEGRKQCSVLCALKAEAVSVFCSLFSVRC